jgi:hypothetical protein
MKRELIDSVRRDLQCYAGYVDASARKIERYCTDLAMEFEELNKNSAKYNLSLDQMDKEYSTKADDFGNKLYVKTDDYNKGQLIHLASGCGRVALSPDMKRQLKLYEYAKPTMTRMYDELEDVDELWLFDTKSNVALGRIEYRFADYILPGMDATQLYDFGITFYDWFRFTDKKQNPNRKALWSPMAFIEMFHQWIMNLTVPVYNHRYSENEEMIAIIATHINLDWVMANTIEKNTMRMMIIKDDSTLIGMNGPAKKDIRLETFNINNYSYSTVFDGSVIQNKKPFVYETLNLEHDKIDEVVSFSKKVKAEFQFHHTLYNKNYMVIRERAPELGLNFIALLDEIE